MISAPAPEPATPPPPTARQRHTPWAHGGRVWLGWVATLVTGLVLVAGALGALLGTTSGSQWLLNRLPGVQASGVSGAWLGPTLRVSQLDWRAAGQHLHIAELELAGLQWLGWAPRQADGPAGQAWVPRVALALAQAQQVRWQSAPPDPAAPAQTPRSPPTDLSLPLQWHLARVVIGRLQIDQAPELLGIEAEAQLGQALGLGRSQHRLTRLSAHTDRLRLEAEATLAAQSPLTLQAQARAQQAPGLAPWTATLDAHGPLASLAVSAQLQGMAGWTALASTSAPASRPTRPPAAAAPTLPRFELQAELRPFAAWPVGPVHFHSQALDLNALASQAPRTALDAQAQLSTAGPGAPVQAQLRLSNSQSGRWDEGRLPVRQLRAELSGQWDAESQALGGLKLHSMEALFGSPMAPSGHISGQAQLGASGPSGRPFELALSLKDFRAAGLDQRLPNVWLNGPVTASGRWPAATPAGGATAWWPSQATLRVDLNGRVPLQSGGDAPAQLKSQLAWQGGRLSLPVLEVQAAGSRLAMSGWLQAPVNDRWQWQAQATLKDFDPRPWWPGAPDSPWRQGQSRLSLSLASEASLPRGPSATVAVLAASASRDAPGKDTALAWLRQARGQLSLNLAPSVLANVPVQAQFDWQASPTAHAAQAELSAGGNRLNAHWQQAHAGRDQGQLSLVAPQLAALAPWLRAWPEWAAHWPQAGGLRAQVSAEGLPGDLRWHIQAQSDGWRSADFGLKQATLSARAGPDRRAPVQMEASAEGWQAAGLTLAKAQLKLDGTAEHHHLDLDAVTAQSPPRWFAHWMGADPDSGSRLQLRAEGRWQDDAATQLPGGSRWSGRLHEFSAGARNGSGQPWLNTQAVDGVLDLDATGRPAAARLSPGKLTLPGTHLQWQAAFWQHRPGTLPRVQFEAELAPFAVANLLDRMQPDIGWRGDLALGASFQVRINTEVAVDVLVERRSGDLSIREEGSLPARQEPLEISDLRLGLRVAQGQWAITQGLAGRRLGGMAGVVSVTTSPQALAPPADATLSGTWQADVANLAAWGAWVQPGWRLGGQLHSAATLGGSLREPRLNGRIDGHDLSLTQVLEGVQWRDGRLALRLDGSRATLETLSLKAGEGEARLSGQAQFGEHGQAELQLQAERFQLLGRVDRRLVVSGQGEMKLGREQVQLSSQLKVDEGVFDFSRADAPSLANDVRVVDESSRVEAAPPDSGATTSVRPLVIQAKLDLGNKLRIKGRGLDARLGGVLNVDNPGRKLGLKGTVRAEEGSYDAYGQKLEIERGQLEFIGPLDDPRLNIYAVRPNLDVKVGVLVTGSALNPRVRLASDTDMSELDKLSWLMLGRATDGLGQADVALLQRAALALLLGEGGGPVDGLIKGLGLTDISLRQTTDANDVRTMVVSVGKQLSRRWYVGYERSVNAAAGTWQLIYRVAQSFTLRAQSGEDSALDLIWSWRWE